MKCGLSGAGRMIYYVYSAYTRYQVYCTSQLEKDRFVRRYSIVTYLLPRLQPKTLELLPTLRPLVSGQEELLLVYCSTYSMEYVYHGESWRRK